MESETNKNSPLLRFPFEVVALFLVFALYGSNAVPDVNEVYYVGKAIHFWQPDWIAGDEFLNGTDAHVFFYTVFGWLSFFCSPVTMTLLGRFTAWLLLAYSWNRLSYALIPVRCASILTGLGLAYYTLNFHEAGEWVIGGVEGKTFAYPFVFLALESFLKKRYKPCILFFGIACAFHILVGGWAAAVMLGVAVTAERKRSFCEPKDIQKIPAYIQFRTYIPGIAALILLFLLGFVPALQLDYGTPSEIVHQARQIYCFDRLQHHLVPYLFQPHLRWRFFLLVLIWFFFCRLSGGGQKSSIRYQLFDGFIYGTLLLVCFGYIFAYFFSSNKELSAAVLRFYWFRWADIAVPMGVAIGSVRLFLKWFKQFYITKTNSLFLYKDLGFYLQTFVCIAAVYGFSALFFFYYCGFKADSAVPWAASVLILGYFIWSTKRGTHFKYAKMFSPQMRQEQIVIGIQALFCLFILYFTLAVYAPFTSLFPAMDARCKPSYPRSEPVGINGAVVAPQWYELCNWVKENTPKDAKFWIPRDSTTFKWYARRSDAGTWKNIPQDAAGIVRWRKSMDDLFTYKDPASGEIMTDRLLTALLINKTPEEILALQNIYKFDYVVCLRSLEMPEKDILLPVYQNKVYWVYQIKNAGIINTE